MGEQNLSAALEQGLNLNGKTGKAAPSAAAPVEDHAKDRYGFLPANFTVIKHEGMANSLVRLSYRRGRLGMD